MLVPAMHSTGMRSRSSTFSTPTCANPRAPPPPSTRQVFASAIVAHTNSTHATSARAKRFSEAITQESAIDCNAFAGDVRRSRKGKECDGRGDFFGIADAAHRRARQHFLEIRRVGEH